MSSSSRARVLRSLASGLALLAALGCHEDIELAPPQGAPEPSGDCSASVPEGLQAARPPMGWNGWNAFGCAEELDEAKVMATAEVLVDTGMQSAGYRYVNLDDCWQIGRDAEGGRVFDPERLPSGIEALSNWVHERGLSFGMFSHMQDCGVSPGGEGYETEDAASYAAWRVDYLKYTDCGSRSPTLNVVVGDLVAAMAEAGRPPIVSLATSSFQEWMRDTAQLWRTSGPAAPTWDSIVRSIDATVPLAAYARPGAFNDPDMLEIGNGALTVGEQRAQFSVWSILSAPLLAGNDLTEMTDETLEILTNSEVIALDQDPLGLQAAPIKGEGEVDVLAKPLAACGARAVVLWNRSETEAEASVTWQDLWLERDAATVHDLWTNSELASGQDGFSVMVPGHDAVALRVEGTEPPPPRGRVHLSDLRWTYAVNGFGPVELDQTNGESQPNDGAPIRLRGAAYDMGLGVHGPSLIRYRLAQRCSRFIADVGVDDDQDGQGSVQFEVWADGERLFQSGVVTGTSPTHSVDINVRDKRELRLFVGIGGDGDARDHAVWAGALLECSP